MKNLTFTFVVLALLLFNGLVKSQTWNGSISSDWSNPLNWTPNTVPTASTDVSIPNVTTKPIISTTAAVCRNITIAALSSLTINAAKDLSVAGIFLNNGILNNSGSFILLSNSSNTAVISGSGTGTINGNITIQRYIPGNGFYNYVSSPIASANKTILGSPTHLYYYNSASGWLNFTSGNLNDGQGYAAYYTNSPTLSFTGVPNTGNITTNISFGTYTQSSIAYTDYNLIGNPYPSPIDISSFQTANSSNLNATVSLWDRSDYATTNALGFFTNSPTGKLTGLNYIPSAQGFFVKAKNHSLSTVSFNNGMRTTTNNVFAKSAKGIDTIQRLFMNITNKDGLYNEILIAFKKDATDGIDPDYDSQKIIGNPDIALYSIIEGQPFVIQTLPFLTGNDSAKIGMIVSKAGEYSLGLESLTNFELGTEIILEDKDLNSFIDFEQDSTYTFNLATSGTFNDRFYVHFIPKSTAVINFKDLSQSCKLYTINKNLLINYQNSENAQATLNVYNVNGQSILKNVLLKNGNSNIHLDVNSGIYIVNIISKDIVITKKVFIN